MNYQQSLDYIQSLIPTLEKPSLERIKLFYSERDNCQDALASFHVGGTNGKGSVSTLLTAMLSALGYKCGKFTGPHLIQFNERFVINDGKAINDESKDDESTDDKARGDKAISPSRFAEIATTTRQFSEAFKASHNELGGLTWFEYLFAMAVEFFGSEAVDYSVIEVGMGGRFDATNVINNVLVSVITNVDLDHMQFLGNTRAEIAFEKSGILKPGVPVVTTCDGEALAVVLKRAAALRCKVYVLGDIDMKQGDKIFQTFSVQCYTGEDAGSSGDTRSGSNLPVDLPVVSLLKEKFFAPLLDGGKFQAGLPGAYQRINVITAVLALWASGCVEFNDDNIKSMQSGLLAARWAGRFEIIESEKLILDGAHNPHGAAALRASLLDKFSRQARFVFILSCFENKNAEQLLGSLVSSGDMVITFNAGDNTENTRKMHSPETLMAIARNIGAQACHAETFEKAVEVGRQLGDQFAPYLVVAGSFVSVRAAINMLMLRKSAGEL